MTNFAFIIMNNKILNTATDLFLSYGFKSVTMDDIASKMGISKKTIYQHYTNKTKLVEASVKGLFNFISKGIDVICAEQKNPIEEIYVIKHFSMEHLKDEKSSPQYQLQKYYPNIFKTLKTKQFDLIHTCITNNINRGIKNKLYRENINVDFIARLYFNAILAIKDEDLFPGKKFSIDQLTTDFLEYHLRGICTPKGLETLNAFITINQKTK